MTGARVGDAITEWWTHPIATQITPTRTVLGAVSASGEILACELDHVSGVTRRQVLAVTEPDDHNCPAMWAAAGHRSVLVWSRHGRDRLLRVHVSGPDGDVGTFGAVSAFDVGGSVSYAQVHRIAALSSADLDVFWIFCRVTTLTWQMVALSVSQSTGAVSFSDPVSLLTATAQTYISTADAHGSGDQVIRFAWGYNPAASVHAIRYVEINAATGAITSPVDGGVAANMSGAGLPLVDTDVAPLIEEPPAGWSRRLFYVRPGPMPAGVAFADWEVTNPDAAEYKVAGRVGSSWPVASYGTAGPRVGYTEAANYLPGMSFPDPCTADEVVLARQADDLSSVEHVINGNGRILASSGSSRLIRPVVPVGATVARTLASDVTEYGATNYTTYQSSVVALQGETAPVVQVLSNALTILCGELRTGRIIGAVPYTAASWDSAHREAGYIQVTVPLLSDEVTRNPELFLGLEGARSFLAAEYRGVVLEAGPIWAHQMDGGSSVQIRAGGLWSLWDHRRVVRVLSARQNPATAAPLKWSGVSLGTIAKRLVAAMMAHTGGDLPLDLPADVTGAQVREYPAHELAAAGDRLRQLMGVAGGPDIVFRPRLVDGGTGLRWSMLTGKPNAPMVHQSGADWEWDTTVARGQATSLTVARDWSGLSMRHWATGEGTDESLLIERAQDMTLVGYGYPLLESTSAHSTVKNRSTLLGHAQSGVRRASRPFGTWTLGTLASGTPSVDQYRTGDFARVAVPDDHPYLRHYLPGGRYRTRIVRISGDESGRVEVSFQPQMEAR